jgi:hypothetical protein
MRRAPLKSWSPPQGGGTVGAGCGLLLGLIVGAYWYITADSPSWLVLGAGLAFAAIAFAYGDRFWHWVVEHPWWF